MLVLSETQVRKCLSMKKCIAANRLALGALRLKEKEKIFSPAVVPSRIALPFGSSPQDNTLFKPVGFYGKDETLMGMKVISVRGQNSDIGLPLAPATITVLNAKTGEVTAIVAATYLTAARTAAGSAIATQIALEQNEAQSCENLVVLGAGLQAECHIAALVELFREKIKNVTIVNRSLGRANDLRETLMTRPEMQHINFKVVLFGMEQEFKSSVENANIICTAINSTSPIFNWNWITHSCHINGVGSYNENMEEVDSTFVRDRCVVVADTKEALSVGDLSKISVSHPSFRGLLGDVMAGVASYKTVDDSKCTMFKSTGTAVQDLFTAEAVVKAANDMCIGTHIDMN
jgi:ornithine cyclodeaminase